MDKLVIDTETDSLDPFTGELKYIGYSLNKEPVKLVNHYLGKDEELFRLVQDKDILKCFHHANFDLLWLNLNGYPTLEPYFDTHIYHHLLSPLEPSGLKELTKKLLRKRVTTLKEICEHKDPERSDYIKIGMDNTKGYGWVRKDKLEQYLTEDVENTASLTDLAFEKGIPEYYWKYEQPLIQIILDMELNGMRVDTNELKFLYSTYRREAQELEEYFKVKDINPRSSVQVRAEILKDK